MRRSKSILVITAAALVAGLIAPLSVSAIEGEVTAVWKDYVVAQKRLQFDLARLLSHKWPELEGIANLQRDQQFAALELRNKKFQYLLEHTPDRIVMDQGLTAFAEFEWTERDDDELRATDPGFAKLQQWAETNAERLSRHPQLAAAGESLLALQRDEYYLLVIQRFQTRLNDLETTLVSQARKSQSSKPSRSRTR
jgi:hypothetical protein